MIHAALATTFALAALSKLREPTPPAALSSFVDVDKTTLRRAVIALSLAELGLAAVLVSPTAHVGAIIAFVFLAASGVLVVAHPRGRRAPDCGCFGSELQVSDSRLRYARHVGFLMFAAASVVVPYRPGPTEIVAGIAVGVAFILVWPLLSVQAPQRGLPGGTT